MSVGKQLSLESFMNSWIRISVFDVGRNLVLDLCWLENRANDIGMQVGHGWGSCSLHQILACRKICFPKYKIWD